MDENSDKIRKAMISGFIETILIASETEIAGERAAFVNSAIALDALIHLQAAIIESSPEIRTRKDIRDLTQVVEKKLRRGVETLRREYQSTGRRAIPTLRSN